jgi:hypothetical protein
LSKDDYTEGGVCVAKDSTTTNAEDIALPTKLSPPLSNSKTNASFYTVHFRALKSSSEMKTN